MLARLFGAILAGIEGALLTYSFYWSYLVLSGPLPSFDLRGHLYLMVTLALVFIGPLLLFLKSAKIAVIALLVSLLAAQFGTYLGVRYSERIAASIAIYGGALVLLCWTLMYVLRSSACSRGAISGDFWSSMSAIFFGSFVWFALKVGCQPQTNPDMFFGLTVDSRMFLLMAMYALLLVWGVACLPVAAAKVVWFVEMMLFAAAVHSFSLGGSEAQWLGELLVSVMLTAAGIVLVHALIRLKRNH